MVTDTTKWIKVFQTRMDNYLKYSLTTYYVGIGLCKGLKCQECPFIICGRCQLLEEGGAFYHIGRVLLDALEEQDALKATAYFEILKDIVVKGGQEDSIVKPFSK